MAYRRRAKSRSHGVKSHQPKVFSGRAGEQRWQESPSSRSQQGAFSFRQAPLCLTKSRTRTTGKGARPADLGLALGSEMQPGEDRFAQGARQKQHTNDETLRSARLPSVGYDTRRECRITWLSSAAVEATGCRPEFTPGAADERQDRTRNRGRRWPWNACDAGVSRCGRNRHWHVAENTTI